MATTASSREAQRQQALIAAIDACGQGHGHRLAAPALPAELHLHEAGARAARGLEVYLANAEAAAARALAFAFPTVQTMVGAEDFHHLAREFRQAWPPQRGDMGEWGDEFPGWLAVHAGMAPWPYLGDCARLDLALHRNERAADAAFDAESLSLLASTDPERLHLEWMPGVQWLRSAWPVATIHQAHQADADARARAFEDVRAALAEPRAESVLVARAGWRARVHRLDAAEAAWTDTLQRGASLGAALAEADAGFDFALWLGRALRESWLKGVVVASD